jgi:hypothetical protein
VLAHAPAGTRSEPQRVARELLRLRTRPALVFWITDGADACDRERPRWRRATTSSCRLRGPWADPPRAGAVRFADPRAARCAWSTSATRASTPSSRAASRARREVASLARRVGADAIEFTVDGPPAAPLAEWCRRQRERLR